MVSKSKWLGGKKAQSNGKQFEQVLIKYCHQENIAVKKIDPAFHQVGNKIWRSQSGCDFILGYKSIAVFVDAKSIDSDRISYSFLKPHQIADLKYWGNSGFTSGLIVWFRKSNVISFIHIDELLKLNPGESIKDHETIQLGTYYNFNLVRLFTWRRDFPQLPIPK